MSQKEFQRVKVIENAAGGRLSVGEAARLLQLSERQVQRLKRRYQPNSIAWVQHGNRGRPMPWALPLPQKLLILTLARGKYQGFNDSHLCQKLNAEENLPVSRETVRRILRGAQLASPQKRRPRKYRSRRLPRPRFGMMALTDASTHDWLEGRGPQLTLIGFQYDATKQILAAHFQLEPENTVGYLRALRSMITTHGVPLSLYRDRHSIFQRNDAHWTVAEQLAGQQTPTHLGRALDELGIQQIPAYSPQAKGRIERLWRTCQDRLVSELRLAQATTAEQANTVLATFCADYNQRFARPAADAACDFRTLPRRFDLARCLSFRYQRLVSPDHVVTLGTNAIALPPRLRRGHRRTFSSTRRLPARLSRRPVALDARSAAPGTRRPPPRSPHHRAETQAAAHLQPLRPPCSGGRYLNVKGVTQSRCSYYDIFSLHQHDRADAKSLQATRATSAFLLWSNITGSQRVLLPR